MLIAKERESAPNAKVFVISILQHGKAKCQEKM
jgi:hypothetical protein